MRGEFIAVWPETWREIWRKLANKTNVPPDLFCELYRAINKILVEPLDVTPLAAIIDDINQAQRAFRDIKTEQIKSEVLLLNFLEKAHFIIDDLGGDKFSNDYFQIVERFIEKYSLRYDLRRPFSLHPTLSGLFSRLIRELNAHTKRDANLYELMQDFEESIRDLEKIPSSRKIKTCIQKQVNLLEAIGKDCPNINRGTNTLGAICNEVGTWPHDKLKEAMKNVYNFASDYPGIRHAGTPSNAIRDIEMRDLISVCILLAGFSPYLTDQFDSNLIYGRQ